MLTKACGIASLVCAIAAIFIPVVVGVFAAGLSGVLAWLSVGRTRFLGMAAVIINILNIFFFSPTFLVLAPLEASRRSPEQGETFHIWVVVLIIQIVAIILFLLNGCLDFYLKRRQRRSEFSSHEGGGAGSHPRPDRGLDEPRMAAAPAKNFPRNLGATSPSRLTRVIARKIHGGRKEAGDFWQRGQDGLLGIAIEPRRQAKRGGFSPLVLGATVFLIGLSIWAGYNFYFQAEPYVPLTRVYEGNNPPHRAAAQVNPVKPVGPEPPSDAKYIPEDKQKNDNKAGLVLDEQIYSWEDDQGRVHFTNVNPPASGAIRSHPELVDGKTRTPVEIVDGKVYVPITLVHSGKRLDTSIRLDANVPETILPQRVLNFIKAEHLGLSTSASDSNSQLAREIRKVDYLKAGPNVKQDFTVTAQSNDASRGVLGMDFLKDFPFRVDYDKQLIVW